MGGSKIATTRIMPIHAGKAKNIGRALSAVIDYVKNADKTNNGSLIYLMFLEGASMCAIAKRLTNLDVHPLQSLKSMRQKASSQRSFHAFWNVWKRSLSSGARSHTC